MSKRFTYVNGKILPHERAVVRVDDIGLSRAFGVYDGIMTYGGRPFEFARHYARLSRSAKLLGLRVPVSDKELEGIILALVKKNAFAHPIVRVLLTGGTTLGGIDFDPRRPTLIVQLEELSRPSAQSYKSGVRVITHEYERQIPEAKTVNYIAAVRLQKAMRSAKAPEAIYICRGKALEATTSNLFIVKRGVVMTPKTRILNGITRQVTMELAKAAGYKVIEKELSVRDLFAADEVFLTSSFKEILPVSSIDGKKIGNGKPGRVTKDLASRFAARVRV
jgi:branched-chain amino acid aminotransferase